MKSQLFILCLTLSLFASNEVIGQNHRVNFMRSFSVGDTAKQKEILSNWELEEPKNPDLFICYFNYFFKLAESEQLFVNENGGLDNFEFKTTSGQQIGYLDNKVNYDLSLFNKALEKIEEGIELYPNRLDMRYGIISAYEKSGKWVRFTDEIIKTIKYSKTIGNHWKWTDHTVFVGGELAFLKGIDQFQAHLFESGDDALLSHMRVIADEVLAHYPDHMQSYNDLGIAYILTEEYDKALEVMLMAENKEPENPTIMGNIAYIYKLKGDYNSAIRYYEMVRLFADSDQGQFANEQILLLKQK
ncbi:MAG: tetratricopeptide repeat protein [Crocinitomicaceae bacterium]|nr:tetratricopeptide repeat protein [Crocinitomicaceae bacterium]